MLAAVTAVKSDKMTAALASRKFNIPMATLHDHVKGKVDRVGAGAPTVLTEKEKKEIVVSVQVLQEIGFGLMKELVGMVIRDYLADLPDRPNPFINGVPGKDWWQLFLKRWQSELSIRKPQQLSAHRALSASLGSVVQTSKKSFQSNRFKCITC